MSKAPSPIQLDRSSPVPLGRQVRRQLEQAIRSGSLAAGDYLPAQRQLADKLGVTVVTISKAVQPLRAAGLVDFDRRARRLRVLAGHEMTQEEREKSIEEEVVLLLDHADRLGVSRRFIAKAVKDRPKAG